MPTALIGVLPALAVVATALWVWSDAGRLARQGRPVVFRLGAFAVETPAAWCVACLLLWVVFFPIYVVARG